MSALHFNGCDHTGDADPGTPTLRVLRDKLGMIRGINCVAGCA
ncbi:hypothetical protein [Ralstonia solanacearum]